MSRLWLWSGMWSWSRAAAILDVVDVETNVDAATFSIPLLPPLLILIALVFYSYAHTHTHTHAHTQTHTYTHTFTYFYA